MAPGAGPYGAAMATRSKGTATWAELNSKHPQAGRSEIRKWLAVAELAWELDVDRVQCLPGYRSDALTGSGLCFAGCWVFL